MRSFFLSSFTIVSLESIALDCIWSLFLRSLSTPLFLFYFSISYVNLHSSRHFSWYLIFTSIHLFYFFLYFTSISILWAPGLLRPPTPYGPLLLVLSHLQGSEGGGGSNNPGANDYHRSSFCSTLITVDCYNKS